MKLTREVKIGAFTVIVLSLFFIGINFLKGVDLFNRNRTYYGLYKSVNGLIVSAPVTVNGLKIGKVSDIRFANNKANMILVEFTVTNKIFIPKDTKARIASVDLMGTKGVEFILGSMQTAALSNDTLKADVQLSLMEEINGQMSPLKQKTEGLLGSLDTLVVQLQSVLNAETRDNIQMSFKHIRSTLQNLDRTSVYVDTLVYGQRQRLVNILGNLESISQNFKNNNQTISNAVNNFSRISDTLAKANLGNTIRKLNTTVDNIANSMNKVKNGEGSLGMLINDDKLYHNLDQSSKELDLLIKDIKANPGRYVHFSVFPPKIKTTTPTTTIQK